MDQPCCILHSGGTTGVPKNIILTNGNFNALVAQAKIVFPKLGVGDRMLTVLPMFHCFGLIVSMHAPLCLGASSILVPQFDAKRIDKLFITNSNITFIIGGSYGTSYTTTTATTKYADCVLARGRYSNGLLAQGRISETSHTVPAKWHRIWRYRLSASR